MPGRDRVERSYCLARLGGRRSMRWLSGWICRTDDVVRQGANLDLEVSIDASITRPELRQGGEQQRRWGLGTLRRLGRQRALLLAGLLLLAAGHPCGSNSDWPRHTVRLMQVQPAGVPRCPGTQYLRSRDLQLSHGEKAPHPRYRHLEALDRHGRMSTPPHAYIDSIYLMKKERGPRAPGETSAGLCPAVLCPLAPGWPP